MEEFIKKFQVGGYTPTELTESKFIPTYAGAPLAESKEYGSKLAEIYHKNISDLTKLDILNSQRKVLEGDRELSEAYDNELKSQFEQMASSGNYEDMTSQVNELARRHYNNKTIQALSESKANADKEDDLIMKLGAQGIKPWFVQDRSKHQTISYDADGKVQYNVFKGTAEAPLDRQAKRAKIWSVVEPNMSQLSGDQVKNVMQAIPGYISTGEWKGITDKRIKGLLDNALKSYEDTPEYSQELRYETEQLGNSEAAKAEIRKSMLSEGLLKTFSQTNPQYLRDYSLEDAVRRANMSQEGAAFDDEALPGVQLKNTLGFDISDFEVRDRSGMKTEEAAKVTLNGITIPANPRAPSKRNVPYDFKGQSPTITEGQRGAFNTAATAGTLIFGGQEAAGKASELGTDYYNTPEAYSYAKQYSDMINQRTIFPSVKSYALDADPTMAERRTEQLQNHIGSRIAYDLETGETINTNAGGKINPEFMELIGGKVTNLRATGSLNPKNPYYRVTGNPRFADAELVQVRNEKTGEVKEMLISKPESFYKTGMGKRNLITNVIWDKLALTPGQRHSFKIEGTDVDAMSVPDPNDASGRSDQIMVWKVGKFDFPEGKLIPAGYDGLINVIERSNQE